MSLLHPDREEAMVSTYNYLRRRLAPEVFREFLKMENNQGLRPIEHAANVAAFRMFTVILDTEGRETIDPFRGFRCKIRAHSSELKEPFLAFISTA